MALVSRRWLLNAATVAVLMATIVVVWKWEDIQRLRTVNSLFAEENIVHNFSHMDGAFLHAQLTAPQQQAAALINDPKTLPDLNAWVRERSLTSLVVLKDGKLAFEEYYQGTQAEDRRISWSIAKSYLSALMGVLVEEGAINSIDDPVTTYLPGLEGRAYDGASIRDVLQMASGVEINEDYLDPKSDINKMGRALALGGSMDDYAAGFRKRDREPGAEWKYVSIDTHVAGMVIRAATGKSVIELLDEKIMQPLRLEQNPYYLTGGYGVAFVLGGLNMRTRDYARFGQMFLQKGEWHGQQVVPEAWVLESTAPSSPTKEGSIQYGYQWWVPADAEEGEYFARGIYGQYVYVNTANNVVIAMTAADRNFRDKEAHTQNLAMFREIVASLNEH